MNIKAMITDILQQIDSIKSILDGYCPVIIPPVRRSDYISALQKTNRGDLNTLRVLILSIVYEEMKALRKLVERLIR